MTFVSRQSVQKEYWRELQYASEEAMAGAPLQEIQKRLETFMEAQRGAARNTDKAGLRARAMLALIADATQCIRLCLGIQQIREYMDAGLRDFAKSAYAELKPIAETLSESVPTQDFIGLTNELIQKWPGIIAGHHVSSRSSDSNDVHKNTATTGMQVPPSGFTPSGTMIVQVPDSGISVSDAPQITLKVTRGPLTGQKFIFDEPAAYIIGREPGCKPRLPDDESHRGVSRHHCLLDVNPPAIRIRDFGSLNGTYVNGKKIGQRAEHIATAEITKLKFPECDLVNGDEIVIGGTALQVSILIPGTVPVFTPGSIKCCARCGEDMSTEPGAFGDGESLCIRCKSVPELVMRTLLSLAESGEKQTQMLHDYKIIQELGRGGMGAVYLAQNKVSNEVLALKLMLPRVALESRFQASFQREIENTKALDHPAIVRILNSGCSKGAFFLAMEFCNGGTVKSLVQNRGGKLSVAEALPIIFDVLDGLEYAHNVIIPHIKMANGKSVSGRGLIHRDLSPPNIMLHEVQGQRRAKIADFGLGKAFEQAGLTGFTRTGDTAGKPSFMPRQQVVNFKYAQPEVDVWAAAATLYNMLTGEFPRDFPEGKDIWQTVLQTPAVPIRKRDPDLPQQLADLIDEALVDNPEIKFKSAAAFKAALQQAVSA